MNNLNISFAINLILSTATLMVVYFLQYILEMHPCEMCINERYPYFILIILSLIFFAYTKISNNSLIRFISIIKYLSVFVILGALIYSFMHVGIERGFIENFSACSGSLSDINNAESLLLALEETPLIRCDDPVLLFNFISIAESNFLLLTLLLLINIYLLFYKE